MTAEEIVRVLRKIRTTLNNELGFGWQKQWIEKIGVDIRLSSTKDWFVGRASVPLIAIEKLIEFGCEEEVREIMDNAEYFCSTTGKATRLPKEINEDLAYLAGAILCDGHLRKDGYSVYYELTERKLVKKFQEKIHNNFEIDRPIKKINSRQGCKQRYIVRIDNKPIFRFFNFFFNMPRGKKADKTKIPEVIINTDKEIKSAFLEGVFDTDGGKRHRGYGLSTSSQRFRDQIAYLLEEFGVKCLKDEWINKKYNKKYFGLSFHKRYGFLPFLHG